MKHPNLKTTPEISKRMSNVKLKQNKYENMLAKALWHRGYRYHLNYKCLPGSPDIALTKYCIAIFIDGEFWHGKNFDEKKLTLKRNKDYWVEKINENIERDARNDKLLHESGWIPLHFWSKDIEHNLSYCLSIIEDFIYYQANGSVD